MKRVVLLTLSPGQESGDFSCASDDCPYKKECSQHVTAGDWRSESGPPPDVRCEGKEIVCYELIRQDLSGMVRLERGELLACDFGHKDLLHGDVTKAEAALAKYKNSKSKANYKALKMQIGALKRKPLPTE